LKIQENITDRVGAFKIVNNYYPNDQIKEIIKYGAGNVIEEKWEYTYTADSQEIKIFSTDNILTAIIRKKFDSKGNLLDETRTDAKGNETKRTSYTYDSKARLASMAEYFSGKISKTLYYKYNNFDLVEEITQENPDGQKFTQASYKYDPKGNLLEERWSEDSTEEFSHKQSRYDKDGNLLEMDSYFAPYRYRVFYKYTYEYYK
jgi:YD repeat-containing protein